MKATIETMKPEGFSPVTLTIVFETKHELDTFTCLMNNGAVVAALSPDKYSDILWSACNLAGGSSSGTDTLWAKLRRVF